MKDLPIIALTAGALVEERANAMAAGMTDFLSKPLDPEDLLKKVRKLVEKRHGAPLQLVSPVQTAQLPRVRVEEMAWKPIDGFDMKQAAVRLSGDWPLFLSILKRIFKDNASLTSAPAEEGDAAWRSQLSAQLHKLRGAAGTVGADQLMLLAGAGEHASQSSDLPVLPVLRALAKELLTLQDSASSVLAVQTSPSDGDALTAHSDQMTPAQLEEITQMLKGNDLEALDWVEKHASAIRSSLGQTAAEELQHATEELRFSDALLALIPLSKSDDST